ncbi:MAG TPA: ABC transporter substrate-binding protein [Thermoleophilaceae bacterium]|nr:ABC transporter substrate-binding protein [Thermoleophilaceae bacterium]
MRTAKNLRPLLALAAFLAVALLAAAPAAQAAPKRIVALTPFAANTLAGLGVTPVAIGNTLGGDKRFASNLKSAKRLTLSHPNGPNMEELALLNPQLVFSSPTWAKGAKTMRDLDIKVVNADPANVADAYATTKMIGAKIGKASGGELLAKRLKQQVDNAARGIRKRPRTLVVLGVGRTPFVLLPNSWGGSIVKKAGARLITGGAKPNRSGFVRISDEKILTSNPDVIIAIPHGNADDMSDIAKFLRTNPAWKDSKAVESNRLYVSGDNSLLQASTDIAKVIRSVRAKYLDND